MKIQPAVTSLIFLSSIVCPIFANAKIATWTIFKGATIIDGTGAAPRTDASLAIHGDKIAEIFTGASPKKIPKDATVIDMSGKTILPTFVDAHSHLGLLHGVTSSSSNMTDENIVRQLRQYGDYGIGVVTSLGTDHNSIYALREKQLKGDLNTPRILTAGHGFGVLNAAPPAAMGMDEVYRPSEVGQVKGEVDELARQHPDLVKLWVDDFGGTMEPKMDPEIYKTIIKNAHRHGLKVAAHVYYLADAKRLVADGVDILGHSIRDLPIDDELIQAMKKHNVALIPTLELDETFFIYKDKPNWMNDSFFTNSLEPGVLAWIQSPAYTYKDSERKALSVAEENVKRLNDAGIPLAFGTDSGATILRAQGFSEHRELQLLVASGLTPMQALKVATSGTARILGIDKSIGTLSPGKKASLLILDQNPLDNIANTEQINSVWLEGKKVSTGKPGADEKQIAK